MKKIILPLCSTLVLMNLGCKKSTDGNENEKIDRVSTTSIEKTVNGNKSGSNSYTYKATDGTRAGVTFSNSEKENTLTIEANTNKFQLDRKEGGKYERNGISALVKGDSVIITQGNNVIDLVRDK